MGTRESGTSAARWLVGVTAGVAVAFIAAAVIAQGVQSAITRRANDIIGNAMPSVKLLSMARGEVNEIERALDHVETEPERRAFEAVAAVDRQDIDEQLAAYEALPFFPHERAVFAYVSDALAVYDRHYAEWQASSDPAGSASLKADLSLLDSALQRSTMFDAEQGQRLGLEIQQIRGDANTLVVLVDAIVVLLAAGAVVLALRQLRRAALVRDIEDAAREQREAELREANEALGQFAGRVAHDVLSPLSTTMLSLDLIRESCPDDKRVSRAIERGAAALGRVRSLVDDLLAFARAGGKPESRAEANVASVLRDLFDGLAGQAQQQDISLSLEPVPPGSVACSPGVLTSIVTNLVQNAMKYMGDSRERRIAARVLDTGPSWRIEVSDTGQGIPDDEQQRIFEPYVQLARARGGIGLGLATVERLVRAHGGTVGLRSKVGTGSTFWFELPKAQEVAPAADATTMQPVPA
jgi:signal transduction histidine kinase